MNKLAICTDREDSVKDYDKAIEQLHIIDDVSPELLEEINCIDINLGNIILADELKSDVLIMDERKGRKVAEKLGIKITGTVGVLLQSYSENMISSDEIKTYLDQLKNSNIRLSESLIQKALEML